MSVVFVFKFLRNPLQTFPSQMLSQNVKPGRRPFKFESAMYVNIKRKRLGDLKAMKIVRINGPGTESFETSTCLSYINVRFRVFVGQPPLKFNGNFHTFNSVIRVPNVKTAFSKKFPVIFNTKEFESN